MKNTIQRIGVQAVRFHQIYAFLWISRLNIGYRTQYRKRSCKWQAMKAFF